MLVPAILYKDEIIKNLKRQLYEDEMMYYSGWAGCNLPQIPDEFDGTNYKFAIIDENNKVIGYFAYSYNMHSKCLNNFGLYAFDKNNSIIGKDIFCAIRHMIKAYNPHRMEYSMIGGNPVERHYDNFCRRHNGKKIILTDVFKDRYGEYHDMTIYEIIFDKE